MFLPIKGGFLTPWYVRDATGNIAGTYEEHHEANEEPLLVEVPVYGSGRIGIYKPVYGQTLYEVTDHLGNVRAVIGGSIQTTMLATMEKERQEKESQDFFGMRTTVSARDINHTTTTVSIDGETDLVDPNEVIRLNNRPNGRYSPNPIGGGTMLWVHPGDTIRAEVFAKYARLEQSQNKSQLIALAAMMKNFSPMDNAVEMRKAFQMLGSSDFRSLPAWGKLNDAQLPVFLNGLLFDRDMKLQRFDFDQVSEKARMKEIEDKKEHEKLELEFVAEKEGYLYIYISNESKENLDVYFDDLKVTQVYGTVVAGGDYYPYGLPIEDRQITLEEYRFGYQGLFAEEDEETAWNHFELREYDAIVGRFLTIDPISQFAGPYTGMGNNPVIGVDPSGGVCETCPKTERYSYAINSSDTYIYDPVDGGYVLQGYEHLLFGEQNGNGEGFLFTPNITPDRIAGLENGRPKMGTVEGLILHRTVSSNYPGNWMKSSNKTKGAHFFVDKDGTTYQTASLNVSVGHIYNSSKQMYPAYFGVLTNSNTIGIEVVGHYINGEWEPLTPEQITATSMLVQQLQTLYNVHRDKVYPHEKVQRKTPGEGQTVLDAIITR